MAWCHFFVYFSILWYIHSFHHVLTIHSSVATRRGSSPSFQLSEKNPPGVPSREANSGLPYGKPMHYHLSDIAPLLSNITHNVGCSVKPHFSQNSVPFRFPFRSSKWAIPRHTDFREKKHFFPRNNENHSEPIRGFFSETEFRWQPYNQAAFLPIFQASYLHFVCLFPASNFRCFHSKSTIFYWGLSR